MRTRAATLKVWTALLAALSVAAMVVALAVGPEPARAAFPGSNGAIAFDDESDISRMNSDGFGQTDLTETAFNFQPNWSADGKKIVFVRHSTNNEVYWMDSYGTDSSEQNLTNHAAHDSQPAFFPDYHKIAFVSTRDGGDWDIFKMTVNDAGTITAGPTKLTTSTHADYSPAVSPDGKKIAFVSDRGGTDDIYVINANAPESSNNRAVKLTRSAGADTFPDWSPSGQRIIFSSNRSSNSEVYVMKPVPESRTNRPRNLTANSDSDSNPAFSPDGRKIAFLSNRSNSFGTRDIFRMKADGSSQVNLTDSELVDDNNPSWQPDP